MEALFLVGKSDSENPPGACKQQGQMFFHWGQFDAGKSADKRNLDAFLWQRFLEHKPAGLVRHNVVKTGRERLERKTDWPCEGSGEFDA